MQEDLPEYHAHDEFSNRSSKLEEIRSLGIDPYPAHFKPSATAAEILKEYEGKEIGTSEDAAKGTTPLFTVAGRLVLFRAMGKNAFGQIQDGQERLQIMFNREETKVEGLAENAELTPLKFIEKKLDLGDIIGIEGYLFRTHKGETTLFAKKVTLLCKALLPLPDKHAGLADKGLRYRKRWVDLISNPDVANQLALRSQITRFIRRHFEEKGFLEVETPILQNVFGGAEAKPFTTTLNALHQKMYLRIALEIALKKIMVGGFPKIFEISKVFRNEGIDKTHNPEFTMLEAYAAYWDYNDMMQLVEQLFEKIALLLFNTTELTLPFGPQKEAVTIQLKAPWKRISMKESIKVYGGIDFDAQSDEKLKEILLEKRAADPKEIHAATRGKLMAMLFELLVEPCLIQPHHIIDHPIETTPLCKPHRDPQLRKEGIVERFESFILCREMCNAYSELNDPVLQRSLLTAQSTERKEGADEESYPLDEEFIEAICQGMPPCGGVGIGIDRLVMLFTQAESIRDVIFFPLLNSGQEE